MYVYIVCMESQSLFVYGCVELVCLGRAGGGGDVIETQFKLGSQKWKSKCRVNRHEQTWQDEDVSSQLF